MTKGADNILFKFGDSFATVNGVIKPLPINLERLGDRIMLPLRFLSESFNYRVDWFPETKKIVITR